MRATSGVVWECPVHNLGPTVNWFAALWAFAGLSYLYCQALCICAPLPPILRSALPAPYRREPVKSPLSADVGTPRFQPTTAACSVKRAPEIFPTWTLPLGPDCRGTRPIQAARCRPDLKALMSPIVAVIAGAVITPIPEIVCSRRLTSLARWFFRMAFSIVVREVDLFRTDGFIAAVSEPCPLLGCAAPVVAIKTW